MAILKPLVIINGQIQQLPTGDTIEGQNLTVDLTENDATGTPKVTPVYVDSPGTYKQAKADAAATKNVLGFTTAAVSSGGTGTIQLEGIIEAATGDWDAVTGDVGGLTAGSKYYLDPDTVGMITDNPPTTDADYVCPLGEAISTTKFRIDIDATVLL